MATISVIPSHLPCGLLDVLGVVEHCSPDLQWYCMELEHGFFCGENGEVWPQAWISDLCNKLERIRSGIPLSWDHVRSLASQLRPEDAVLLIATAPDAAAPSWPLNIASPRFEIAIQNADEQSWHITTRNQVLLSRLQAEFETSRIAA